MTWLYALDNGLPFGLYGVFVGGVPSILRNYICARIYSEEFREKHPLDFNINFVPSCLSFNLVFPTVLGACPGYIRKCQALLLLKMHTRFNHVGNNP